jgi:hypothetical protein
VAFGPDLGVQASDGGLGMKGTSASQVFADTAGYEAETAFERPVLPRLKPPGLVFSGRDSVWSFAF